MYSVETGLSETLSLKVSGTRLGLSSLANKQVDMNPWPGLVSPSLVHLFLQHSLIKSRCWSGMVWTQELLLHISWNNFN